MEKIMSISVVLLLLSLFISFKSYGIEGRRIGVSREAQIHSIPQIQYIDEFDCVDIYKQPAFDSVLLKNHKINPKFLPKVEKNKEQLVNEDSNSKSKGCPPGMVPIMRTKVDNLTHLRSMSRLHLGSIYPQTKIDPGTHVAALRRWFDDKVMGARATIEIYNPPVQMGQMSSAQIWLEDGPPPNEVNSVQFGWAVNPQLYKDNLTRLTAFWTTDSAQTGCYNVLCPGFIQTHPTYYLGHPFSKVSTIEGDRYGINPHIFKDKLTGEIGLMYGEFDLVIGYYPKELFTHFEDGASFIQLGGVVYGPPDGLSPPMGGSRFPSSSFKLNSFMIRIGAADEHSTWVPMSVKKMKKFVDNDRCYDVRIWGNLLFDIKQSLSYGGPGGKCGV